MPPCHAAKLQKKRRIVFSLSTFYSINENLVPVEERQGGSKRRKTPCFSFISPAFLAFLADFSLRRAGCCLFSGSGEAILGKNRQEVPRRAPVVRGTKKTPRPVRRDTAWLIQTRVQRFMLLRELP